MFRFLLLAGLMSTGAHATIQSQSRILGAYDLAAPIVQSRDGLTDATAGQIVFDNNDGAFFGLPVGAAPTTASDWTRLSAPQGSNFVVTSGAERIERIRVANNGTCSIASQSGTWVNNVTRPMPGRCTVNITTGTFSAAPVCSCTVTSSYNRFCAIDVNPTAAGLTYEVVDDAGTAQDRDVDIICMGPN